MNYRVKYDTKTYSKPGISPTEKNGNEVGIMRAGVVFVATVKQNGWLSIASNKWVMESACEKLSDVPPPDEPGAVELLQTRRGRRSVDNVETWEPWEEWQRCP